jgi:hypothetical protein
MRPRCSPRPPSRARQLVAPIALYPDALVAQILAAATYPEQIVEAERWMQQHGGLKGQQLAQEVDRQTWDPSVKALTAFPAVLANMDKNLSWTSSLGDAYVNHEPDVMSTIQDMRGRAQAAGSEDDRADDGDPGGTDDRHRAGESAGRLRTAIRSVWWCTERPIVAGRDGIGIRGCSSPHRASRSAWASTSASSAASAGGGITGDAIGIATLSSSTTTSSSRAAEPS